MPRTTKTARPTLLEPQPTVTNGPPGEVLTLAEAASYLRLPENAVQAAVQEQNLPGRFINGEWRFLKAGIQDWLRSGPKPTSNKAGWMALAGTWKGDSNLDELREEIAQQRQRLQSGDER